MPLTIAVLGLGYVGATSMACLAKLGHAVIGVDVAAHKVDLVSRGLSPIQEPGVPELLAEAARDGRVSATVDVKTAIAGADACLVCVGTPSRANGSIDTKYLLDVVASVAEVRRETARTIPVIVRSTCLPSVHDEVIETLRAAVFPDQSVAYCVHPEFLREGQAVDDFFNPPKILFGCTDPVVRGVCEQLYPGFDAPLTFAAPSVASLVKYADNCFHAVKITFANEIGMLASAFNVDARDVMDIFCSDTKLNISARYLRPGMPYGGSCLPKDLRGVVSWARQSAVDLPMLEHIAPSNERQVQKIISRVLDVDRSRVGIIGLAFKDNTDDLRESPMVTMAEHLMGKGRSVRIYDNNLIPGQLVGANRAFAMASLPHLESMMTADCAELVSQSDVVIITRGCGIEGWRNLPWRSDQVVFDFAGVPALREINAAVSGLYWPGASRSDIAVAAE